MAESFAASLGVSQMVDLGGVLNRVLERLHAELGMLLRQNLNGEQRKAQLAAYLHSSRQQLLRMHQLLQWANKAKALAECLDSGKVLDAALTHTRTLKVAADELYAAHMQLMGLAAPNIDLQSALEVLATGTYSRLPLGVEFPNKKPLPAPLRSACARILDDKLLSHLLKARVPRKVHVGRVTNGTVCLHMPSAYEVHLTLTPAPPAGPPGGGDDGKSDGGATTGADELVLEWDLVKLVMLPGMLVASLQEVQTNQLQGDLRQRMHLAARSARQKARELATPDPTQSESTPASDPLPVEADEYAFPIQLMHSILQDVAANIITNGANIVVRRLLSAPSWVGHISMEPPTVLLPGLRVAYWRKSGVLCELDVKTESGNPSTLAAVIPAVEVGINKEGWLQVIHIPALPPMPLSSHLGALQAPSQFSNIELLLLQSAAYHAHHQLVYLEKALQLLLETNPVSPLCHFSWSSSPLAAREAAGGQLGPSCVQGSLDVQCPMLEFCADGAPLLLMTVHLWTGMITLRPGRLYANSTGQTTVKLLLQEESRLQALQLDLLKRTGEKSAASVAAPPLTSLQQSPLVAALAQLCHMTFKHMWLSGLMHCARVLALQPDQCPLDGLLDAYTAANPGRSVDSSTEYVQLAFPPELCCLDFPRLDLNSDDSGIQNAFSTQSNVPRGLQFYLRLPASLHDYVRCCLLVVACNTQSLPLKVLDVVPVPFSVITRATPSLLLGKRTRAEHDCDTAWHIPDPGDDRKEHKLARRHIATAHDLSDFLAGKACHIQHGSTDWRRQCRQAGEQLEEAAGNPQLLELVDTLSERFPALHHLINKVTPGSSTRQVDDQPDNLDHGLDGNVDPGFDHKDSIDGSVDTKENIQRTINHKQPPQSNGVPLSKSARQKWLKWGLELACTAVRTLESLSAEDEQMDWEEVVGRVRALDTTPGPKLFLEKLLERQGDVAFADLMVLALECDAQCRPALELEQGERGEEGGRGEGSGPGSLGAATRIKAEHEEFDMSAPRPLPMDPPPEASTSGRVSGGDWGHCGSDHLLHHLRNIVDWFQWRRTWETLLTQLKALHIDHVIQLGCTSSSSPNPLVTGSCISLSHIPGILSLPYTVSPSQDSYSSASENPLSDLGGEFSTVLHRVELRCEEPADKGAWSCSVFADWAEFAAPGAGGGGATGPAVRGREAVAIPGGFKFMYSLSQGHTLVSALQDLVRAIRIQVLLSRLRQMMPDPLPAPAPPHPLSPSKPVPRPSSPSPGGHIPIKQEPSVPGVVNAGSNLLDLDPLELVGVKPEPDLKSNGVIHDGEHDRDWSPDTQMNGRMSEREQHPGGEESGGRGHDAGPPQLQFVDPLTGMAISLTRATCTRVVLQVQIAAPPTPTPPDEPLPPPSATKSEAWDDGWQILDGADANGVSHPLSETPTPPHPLPALHYFIEWVPPSHPHAPPSQPSPQPGPAPSTPQIPTPKPASTPPLPQTSLRPSATPPGSRDHTNMRSPADSSLSGAASGMPGSNLVPGSSLGGSSILGSGLGGSANPTASSRYPGTDQFPATNSAPVLQDIAGRVRCCVLSRPELPPCILQALEAMLQYNCEDSFLDTLLLTSQPLLAVSQLMQDDHTLDSTPDSHADANLDSNLDTTHGRRHRDSVSSASHMFASCSGAVDVVLRQEGAPGHFHALLSSPGGNRISSVDASSHTQGPVTVGGGKGGLDTLLIDMQPLLGGVSCLRFAASESLPAAAGTSGAAAGLGGSAGKSIATDHGLLRAFEQQLQEALQEELEVGTCTVLPAASGSNSKQDAQVWVVRNHALAGVLGSVRQVWRGELAQGTNS